MLQSIVQGHVAPTPATPSEIEGAPLSPRERQVIRFLADGLTNREIAEQLGIKKKTVDTYRVRIQDKLNLKGRASLVRYVRSQKLYDK